MALQVVSTAINVYRVLSVKDGVENTEEVTFKRGELLPNWVSAYQQFVLTQTGMARQVGDFPDPDLKRPEDVPAPVLMPEHDPRTVLGTNVTGPRNVLRTVEGQDAGKAAGSGHAGDLPADAAPKGDWEDAAVAHGMPRTEAESMTKANLVKELRARGGKAEGK